MTYQKAFAYIVILGGFLIAYQMEFALSSSYMTVSSTIVTPDGVTEGQVIDSGRMSSYESGDTAPALWALIILFVSFITALGFYTNACILIGIGNFLLLILSFLGFISFGVPVYLLAIFALVGTVLISITDGRRERQAQLEEFKREIKL